MKVAGRLLTGLVLVCATAALATDTPEAKIQRTLYILIAVGIIIFLVCGFLYLVVGIIF